MTPPKYALAPLELPPELTYTLPADATSGETIAGTPTEERAAGPNTKSSSRATWAGKR